METDLCGDCKATGELNGDKMIEGRAANAPSAPAAATQRSDATPCPSTPPDSAPRVLRDDAMMGVQRNKLDDASADWVTRKHHAWLCGIGNPPNTTAPREWFAHTRVLGVEEDILDPSTTVDALRSCVSAIVSTRERPLSCYPQILSTPVGPEAASGL